MSTMNNISVTSTSTVDRQRIAALLVGAFEGGCNYWIERQPFGEVVPPNPVAILDADDGEGAKIWPTYDYPLTEGGEVSFTAENGNGENVVVKLNLETLTAGLQVMAEKFPRHFSDFMMENDDADTADVFVQCVAFGDVVYG